MAGKPKQSELSKKIAAVLKDAKRFDGVAEAEKNVSKEQRRERRAGGSK